MRGVFGEDVTEGAPRSLEASAKIALTLLLTRTSTLKVRSSQAKFSPAKKALFNMKDNFWTMRSAVKLHVRRVLVIVKFEELLPRYVGFVREVVGSGDLLLNVSRKQLQPTKIMKVILMNWCAGCLSCWRCLPRMTNQVIRRCSRARRNGCRRGGGE